MAQTLYIQLNNVGANTGPFDLYAVDAAGIETLVQSNVAKSQLLSGLLLTNIPNNAIKIKVKSVSVLCNSYIYINIPYPTTTTSTILPTTTSTTSNVVVPTCTPIYYAKGAVYAYNVSTNLVTPLFVPGITGSTSNNLDIAHTVSKMWFVDFRAGAFIEYNITLSPWSATFSQNVSWPPGFISSSGLYAINNTTLLAVNGATTTSVVGEFNTLTGVFTTKFNLPAGRYVAGDFMLTTTNKFIVLAYDATDAYISQYNYATGVLEFEKKLNPTINNPYGIFESGNLVYIMDGSTGVYSIGTTSPNTITSIGYPTNANPTSLVLGASQIGSCITEEFSNNLTTTTTLKAIPTTTTTTIRPSTTTTTTVSLCNCYTITNLESNPSNVYQLTRVDCFGSQSSVTILPGASYSWCGNGTFNTVTNPSSPTPSTWAYTLVNNGPCGASCPPVPPTTTTSTVTPTTTASPTTSTTTIAPSTTTTTTIACNCITIVNTSGFNQDVWYKDCDKNIALMPFPNSVLPPFQTVQVCGSNATAAQPSLVNITVGGACVSKNCPATTTTTTTAAPFICKSVTFTNSASIINGATYTDCNNQPSKVQLSPGQTSAPICLIVSTIVVSDPRVTYTAISDCLLTTTTTTTASPTTTSTTASPTTTTTTTVAPSTTTTTTQALVAGKIRFQVQNAPGASIGGSNSGTRFTLDAGNTFPVTNGNTSIGTITGNYSGSSIAFNFTNITSVDSRTRFDFYKNGILTSGAVIGVYNNPSNWLGLSWLSTDNVLFKLYIP